MNLLNFFYIRKLKREYRLLYGIHRTDADESLQRQMNFLKAKKPGQTEKWYLEQVIFDLKRDRR